MPYYSGRGDYYGRRGDYGVSYSRNWLSQVGGAILGGIGGFVTGGVGGALGGAIQGFTGGGGPTKPSVGISIGGPKGITIGSGFSQPGTASSNGACGCHQRGTHLNKHWLAPTRGGCGRDPHDWIEPKTVQVTNRRMNPLNPRAAHRAIRRLRSFERIARHVVRFVSPHKARGRAHFARRRRRAA